VHEAHAVRLRQRARHLPQDVHDAAGVLRTELAHERLEIDPIQVLHRVVEDAVRGTSVVEHGHRVRVAELGGELDLALEAGQALRARFVRPQQLDRGRAAQHGVLGAVDHPHAALAELFLEGVLAELARRAHLPAQAVDHAGGHGGGGDGQGHPRRALDDDAGGGGRGARRLVNPQAGGHRHRGQEADDQRP
jgi:hypothetical protein